MNELIALKIKKLHPRATLPTKAHAGDLGYDLYVLENTFIHPNAVTLIETGISCEFPAGYGALIRDRSSIATNRRTFIVAGVIDNGYTGPIKVAMHTLHKDGFAIHAGEKFAQMVLIPTVDFPVQEVTEIISNDGRATGGFGSTNK